jgi:hypothetical protein
MKLTEFNKKPHLMAKKALKENFNTDINLEKMNLNETRTMLGKVKSLISEVRDTNNVYSSETNPTYLKLVFMEQALSSYYNELKYQPEHNSRIVIENENVEQAQVVLAAKDMIDSVQKMIEDVSDMLVKELPAVVDSVNAEIGTNEGEQFNGQATDALSGLQAALTQAKTGLQGALGIVTGQGGGFGAGMDAGLDGGLADPTLDAMDDQAEELPMPPEADEEPEELPTPGVGRGKR